MSIFQTLFGQQKPAGQQQPAQNQHVQSNTQVPNNTNTPVQQATPENPKPESPNAAYADLWSTTNQQQQQGPNFQLDPAKLQEHLSKVDFTKSINRDNVQKIMAGGEEAVGALMDVLNEFGRDVFAKSAGFSSNLGENVYSHATSTMQRGIPDLVTKQLSQQELFQANPKLRDPALQPVVQAVQAQIQQKHPNATPAEVNSMLSKYFTDVVAKAFVPDNTQQNTGERQKTSDDFSNFLS